MLHKFLSSRINVYMLCVVLYSMMTYVLLENNFSFSQTFIVIFISILTNFLYWLLGVANGMVVTVENRADVLYELLKKAREDKPDYEQYEANNVIDSPEED